MTREQQYFLHLVSSHLNNTTPEAPIDIDLSELFKVCELQDMTALTAVELKKLVNSGVITKEQFSPFNQVLGLTLQNYEYKVKGITKLKDVFTKNKIKHVFLKGADIRELYPVPEVRTSGDTDVIVEADKLESVISILNDCGFESKRITDIELDMIYFGELYEIKARIKTINNRINDCLNDLFSDNISDKDVYTYKLKPLYNLLYITSHTLYHLKSGGVGVRQLVDIDIIIRNNDIDISEFIELCEKVGIGKSSKALLELTKEYFNTPVVITYSLEPELKEMLENVILSGGTFGYGIGNIGTRHLTAVIHDSGNNGKFSSMKAFIRLFSIDKGYLYHNYKYAREHNVLLPVAYISRLYSAVFKRGRQNIKNIKSMFTDREIASSICEIITELEL